MHNQLGAVDNRVDLLTAFMLFFVTGQRFDEFHLELAPVADKLDESFLVDKIIELSTECKDQRTDPHETRNEFVHVLFLRQFQPHLTEEERHCPAQNEQRKNGDQIVTESRQPTCFHRNRVGPVKQQTAVVSLIFKYFI